MPRPDKDSLQHAMKYRRNIRNVTLISHLDHGKTTVADVLLCHNQLVSDKAIGDRALHTVAAEKEQGITIKGAAVSLLFDMPEKERSAPRRERSQSERKSESEAQLKEREFVTSDLQHDVEKGNPVSGYLINLLDSPGHIDFSCEVTAALRVSDGALVVVDACGGPGITTESVIRQAIVERVRPVLFLNKIDKALLELQTTPEELYQLFARTVEDVNVSTATYQEENGPLTGVTMDPSVGNVGFGSALYSWAFTLTHFAEMYAGKFGVQVERLLKHLWGDWYFDAESKKWTTAGEEKGLKRGFVQFVLDPIYKVKEAVMEAKEDDMGKLLDRLGVKLTEGEKKQEPKSLLMMIMKRWLPAAETIFHLICHHLPSPLTAQEYRMEHLYMGKKEDDVWKPMTQCDANADVMMFINKMVPTGEKGRFYAFGRVFSGTINTGMKVRLQGPEHEVGTNIDVYEGKTIQRIMILMGKVTETVDSVPAGMICALVGVDQFLVKTGTLTTAKDPANIKPMKFFVSPVVRMAVAPAVPAELPKLVEGLKRMTKGDPVVNCIQEETGEHVVSAIGELHLKLVLNDLEQEHAGIKLSRSEPVVSYRETVSQTSTQICLSKSPNKHNRLYMTAQPMPEGLAEDIDKGEVAAKDEFKARAKYLGDNFGYDVGEARKIWCFGPDGTGPNFLIDVTKGVQYLNEIKDSVASGFHWAAKEGALCNENMRAVRFNLHDVTLHADAIHRGAGQVLPTARRCLLACQLTAAPRLMEPVYLVKIDCPQTQAGGVHQVMNTRRGQIVEEIQVGETPNVQILSYLPVMESFTFTADLRAKTGGQAFASCEFDHWQVLPGDPYDARSIPGQVVAKTRARKGLKEGIPELSDFLDKL